jgi:hypothetical protein
MGSFKLIGKKKAAAMIEVFSRIADSIQALSDSINRLAASGAKLPNKAGEELTEAAERISSEVKNVLKDSVIQNEQIRIPSSEPVRPPVSEISGYIAADEIPAEKETDSKEQHTDTIRNQNPELVPAGYFLNSFIKSSGMTILRLLDMPHAGSIHERIASAIGDSYDDIEPFLKALKYSASNKIPVTISTFKFTKQAKAKCVTLGNLLFKNAMLENYYFKQEKNQIYAKMSENPSVINFITGHWMEIYIFNTLQNMLDSYRKQYNSEIETYGNLQISLPDGNNFELDILGFINAQPLWIECKTGLFQDSITKYKNFGSKFHIPHQNSLMVISGISDEQASSISEIHGFNICTLRNFRNTVTRILDRMCMNISVSTVSEAPSPVNTLLEPDHCLTADDIKNRIEKYGIGIKGSQINNSDLAVMDTAGLLIGRNYIIAKQLLSIIRTAINGINHNGSISLIDRSSYENSCACQIMMTLNKSGMISNYAYKKVMRNITFTSEPSSRLIAFIEGQWFYHYIASLINKFLVKKNIPGFAIARNVELTRGDLSIVIDFAIKTGEQFTFIKTALRDYEKAALEISTLSGNIRDTGNKILLVCHDLTSEKIEKITAQCDICAMNCETFEQKMPEIFGIQKPDAEQSSVPNETEESTAGTSDESSSGNTQKESDGENTDTQNAAESADSDQQVRFKIHTYEFSDEELSLIFENSGLMQKGFDTYSKEMTDSDGCANIIYQNYDQIKNILTSIYVSAIKQNKSILKINAENLPDPVTSALCNLCLAFKRKGWLTDYSYSGNKTRCITIQASDDPRLLSYISRGWLDHRIYSETHKHLKAMLKLTGNQSFRIARNLKLEAEDREILITVMMHIPSGNASSGNIFVKTVLGNSEREADDLMTLGKLLGVGRDYLILVSFGMDQITSRRISSAYGITVVTSGEYHNLLETLTTNTQELQTGSDDSEAAGTAEDNEIICDFSYLEDQNGIYRLLNSAFLQHVSDVKLKLADCTELFDDDNFSVTFIAPYTANLLKLDKLLCTPDDESEINCSVLSFMEPCLSDENNSQISIDIGGLSASRQVLLFRLFSVFEDENYLKILDRNSRSGQFKVKLTNKEKLKEYLSGGWFSHICSRMIEEHIIALTEEYGISNSLFKFGRDMNIRCNDTDFTINFVLKPQIGVAFFNFAADDFEKAAVSLNTIKSQKNLMQDFAVLVCNTDDGELCETLSEKYQIEVIPFDEYEDYLSEYITIEPADTGDESGYTDENREEDDSPDEEEENDENENEDEDENDIRSRLRDYDEMDLLSTFGYCNDLASILHGHGRRRW